MNAVTPAWIELTNVSKRYGQQPVLDGACLTVERGQFVAVMGRSGSGKSTLLRLIGGLEAADAGSVRVDGTDLTVLTETERARRRRRGLGFVFQSFNLIPTLTVTENVELPLALNGVPEAEVRQRSRELLEELGLASCANRFPEDISGGEQQRVADCARGDSRAEARTGRRADRQPRRRDGAPRARVAAAHLPRSQRNVARGDP